MAETIDKRQLSQRWRLVLGRFANKHLPENSLNRTQQQQDKVLEQLYQKHLQRRGMKSGGTLDDSKIQVFEWLNKADKLFPQSVMQKMQSHAVSTFGILELVKHEQTLAQLTPDINLLKQLMAVRSELNPELLSQIRKIIQSVVDDLYQRLEQTFKQKLQGRLNRHQTSPQQVMANLDWHKTLRKNLQFYDRDKQQLMLQHIYFNARNQRHLPWRVILCVDQSGSMSDSMIYTAVIAGILAKLPSIDLKLVLFDTKVIDLSDIAEDPVQVLLSSQMSGGTHIKKAWSYCQQLSQQPAKTLVATVSDFDEGASPSAMLQQARDMLDSGIKMIGITAMTAQAVPFYNCDLSARLQALGMDIAALSPDHFADWLAQKMEL